MCGGVLMSWVLLWCVWMSATQKCTSIKSDSLRFTVTSRRNETGHWIGQVTLDHGAEDNNLGPWDVDVVHVTTLCDGEKSISLEATVTAPAQPLKAGPGLPVRRKQPGQVTYKKTDSTYEFVPTLGYYKLHPIKQTWQTAQEKCATEGTYLLVLNSDEEWKIIKEMWDKYKNTSAVSSTEFLHYGMTDFLLEGNFITIFGEEIYSSGYKKWASGEPNNGVAANCGALRKSGELYDSACTNQFPFICELNL